MLHSISLNGNLLLSLSNIGLTSSLPLWRYPCNNGQWGLPIGNIITSHEPSRCTAQVINRERALHPAAGYSLIHEWFLGVAGEAL